MQTLGIALDTLLLGSMHQGDIHALAPSSRSGNEVGTWRYDEYEEQDEIVQALTPECKSRGSAGPSCQWTA